MDRQSANGLSPKSPQMGGQRKQLPYSVETPYGFRLDLDFLKYVDDIEKGNTIKKVPIHRRTRGPKFSTLPRNFSLPAAGYRSAPQPDVWASAGSLGSAGKTQALPIRQLFGFQACDSEPTTQTAGHGLGSTTSGADASSVRAFDEQPLGFHVRPHLLRASSMPATVLQRKNSELEDEEPQAAAPNGSSENVFCLSGVEAGGSPAQRAKRDLQQQLAAALRRVRELEVEVRSIPELKSRIRSLTEEKEQCLLNETSLQPKPGDSQQLNPEVKTPSRNEDPDAKQHISPLRCHDADLQRSGSMQPSSKQQVALVKGHPVQNANQFEEKADNLSIAKQDEKMGGRLTKQDGVTVGTSSASQLSSYELDRPGIAALQAKLRDLEQRFAEATKELERVNALLREQIVENSIIKEKLQQEREMKREQVAGDSAETRPSPPQAMASTSSGKNVAFEKEVSGKREICSSDSHSSEPKAMNTAGTQTGLTETRDAEVLVNVPTAEKLVEATVATCSRAVGPDSAWASSAQPAAGNPQCVGSEGDTVGPLEDRVEAEADPERRAPAHGEEPCLHGYKGAAAMETSISCYVSRIRDLLHEQWDYLPSGAPESSLACAQDPTSQMNSIQAQLMSTVNALSSLCSLKGQKTGATQEAALKSIMKRTGSTERLGSGGAKKNLKFVGVNGGYETTSSEDSSEEDNGEVDDSQPEGQRGSSREYEERVGEPAVAEGSGGRMELGVRSKTKEAARKAVDEEFIAACHLLKDRLAEMDSPDKEMRRVLTTLYQEWFCVTSRRDSQADTVTLYLSEVGGASPMLLPFVVNLADGNGNTALHYSVSHSNFHIVRLLLNTGLCEVDLQNQAGYTAIMLASLAVTDSPEDMVVARELMRQGNVNAQATQGGQTALALAASHGRVAMARLLLDGGAEPDARDHSGSTALMCACEHGHTEIARLLLEHAHCDASLVNRDGNTALSVATQASHSEIVDLLQAHVDRRPLTPESPSKQPVPSQSSA